jgi:L-lysine 6-transaminase
MNTAFTNHEDILNDVPAILPEKVHEVISKYMLADAFDFVLDLKNSSRTHIVNEINNNRFIDFFTFFASSALGLNHPKLNTPKLRELFGRLSINKPSNSDIYTTYMAEFVDTFAGIAKPDYMKYLFFISGGALAVENGLKTAFDWKVRKNFKKGYKEEKGRQVIHFRQAFHGRTGYTLSLTNTDPAKTNYFPKFNWPRIINPKITFPVDENLQEVIRMEREAVEQIKKAIADNPDDIAVIIIEPVQGEGGDNFFRKEFFNELRQIADENEILLMFDEVQTGFGLTGKFWASEYYVKPDIISFGKKAQVCGIMVSDRIDDIEEHVFRMPSRINSTWGGDLIDMVRSTHIMRIIKEEELVNHSAVTGKYLLRSLQKLQAEFPQIISNARGLGLMCAFDFKTTEARNAFKNDCYKHNLIILGAGEKSIRFRPPLNITTDELDEGLHIIRNILKFMSL